MFSIVKVCSVTETPSNSIREQEGRGHALVLVVEVTDPDEAVWLTDAVGQTVMITDQP